MDITGDQSTSLNGVYNSMFSDANNVQINNGTFKITTNVHMMSNPSLNELFRRVSPNAILNEGGRVDDPKCYPGTREEVIGLIEQKIHNLADDRVTWLSGPAGAGKSAIMKTILERSSVRKDHTINFFFFRGDGTRNSVRPVVPTLLYQLFEPYLSTREIVGRILAARPRLLDGTFAQQCTLISALFPVIRGSRDTRGASITLLIDGLDECNAESQRSPLDILRALEGLVMEAGSPLRLLVASRREAYLQMAFNGLSCHVFSIFLNEDYTPENDIRLFVTAEFDRVKALHPCASFLSTEWPAPGDVEAVVQKSSGHFIYAATVMRYIACRASVVPSLSLEQVLGIVPPSSNSPFAHLDSIYAFILSRVDDPDATRTVLSMGLIEKSHNIHILQELHEFLHIYDPRYSKSVIDSCVSELSALVDYEIGGWSLKIHHASLLDFLEDKTRSGPHWINADAFLADLLVRLWDNSIYEPHLGLDFVMRLLFQSLAKPTPDITHRLLELPFTEWMDLSNMPELSGGYQQIVFMRDIRRLYYDDDIAIYRRVLGRYIRFCISRGTMPDRSRLHEIPHAAEYILHYEKWKWWYKLTS